MPLQYSDSNDTDTSNSSSSYVNHRNHHNDHHEQRGYDSLTYWNLSGQQGVLDMIIVNLHLADKHDGSVDHFVACAEDLSHPITSHAQVQGMATDDVMRLYRWTACFPHDPRNPYSSWVRVCERFRSENYNSDSLPDLARLPPSMVMSLPSIFFQWSG